MKEKEITATVFRFDPSVDEAPYYKRYRVPIVSGTSAMNVLDYIYQHLDDTLAYYDHAGCALGICARCLGRINGKPGLFCQTMVNEDVTLDPLTQKAIIKDLIPMRKKKSSDEVDEACSAG